MSKKNQKNPFPLILLFCFSVALAGLLFLPRVNSQLSGLEAFSRQETQQNTMLEVQGERDLRSEREKWEWIYIKKPMKQQIIQEIKDVFGSDWRTALAIAQAESGLNENAVGDKNLRYWQNGKMYGDSIGIFQIRRFPNRPSKDELLNFKTNIRFAKKLYDKQNWLPWSVYKNKSYLKHL